MAHMGKKATASKTIDLRFFTTHHSVYRRLQDNLICISFYPIILTIQRMSIFFCSAWYFSAILDLQKGKRSRYYIDRE
jgi:hypothetical protein